MPPVAETARTSARAAPRAAAARRRAARRRTPSGRHEAWKQKRQDILLTFTGTARGRVRSAVRRVVGDAKNFGIGVPGRPEARRTLPRGHPPIEGIEHVDPVIMTVVLNCSMGQVIDLLTATPPLNMAIVPIPSERFRA